MKRLLYFLCLFCLPLMVNAKKDVPVLPPPICSPAKTSIHISFVSAHPDSAYDVRIRYYHLLLGKNDERLLRDFDGMYRHQAELGQSTYIALLVNDIRFPVVISPGEDVCITVKAPLLKYPLRKEAVKVSGTHMDEFNTELANYGREYESYDLFEELERDDYASLKGLGANGFKQSLQVVLHEKDSILMADKRISPVTKDYLSNEYHLRFCMYLASAEALLTYANPGMGKVALPIDYFNVMLEEAPYSREIAMYSHAAIILRDHINDLAQMTKVSCKYPDALSPLILAQDADNRIRAYKPLNDDELRQLEYYSPGFYPILFKDNEKVKQALAEKSHHKAFAIKEIPDDLVGENVFKALVSSYRGRPVLLDFWATWCGPCMNAMKSMASLKEEMMGQVAFAYIVGPSSPRTKWEEAIPNIPGDHFYMTKKQWYTLLSQFQTNSIPTYVLVDADGQVVSKFVGFPGVEALDAELKKTLQTDTIQ